MVFPRTIYPHILEHAKTPLVTVLTGMRRTGKTTLVKKLLTDLSNNNALFFDLQRADIRELFRQKNYDALREAFIERGLSSEIPMVIALDEIQLVPEIPEIIKYLYDHYGIKFIVTGSSSYYLKHLFTESLAGRKKVFELFPLNFGEYLTFKDVFHKDADSWDQDFNLDEYRRLSGYYEEYIRFGGFPQVVMAKTDDEKRDILVDILSSYINIDIKTLAGFSDERAYYNLARLLAKRVGNRIEYTKLAKESGLSRQTVSNYVAFFEKTYLIATVPVYTRSIDREIVKARKLYFVDSGLANVLGELSSGAQFENTVYNQLVRKKTVQYYALKTGREIDFIYDKQVALEAKETPIENDLYALSTMAQMAGLSQYHILGRYHSPRFTNYVWGGMIR